MHYSKSTGGFYTAEIHGASIPLDAVEITPDAYLALFDGQASGMLIAADAGGNPVLTVPPSVPSPIPSISPRQIRQALTRAGLRTAVESAVAAGDQDLKDWYEFSTAFERDNPQVDAMGAALGVSAEALDDLWALGATL